MNIIVLSATILFTSIGSFQAVRYSPKTAKWIQSVEVGDFNRIHVGNFFSGTPVCQCAVMDGGPNGLCMIANPSDKRQVLTKNIVDMETGFMKPDEWSRDKDRFERRNRSVQIICQGPKYSR